MRLRAAALALVASGCVIPDLDLSEKHCEDGLCPDGYFCDHSRPMAFPFGACVAGPGRPCDTSRHLICDDFEAEALDPRWVAFAPPGSELAIDPTLAHTGTRSLRATIGESPVAMIQMDPFTGRTFQTEQWARAFVRVADPIETGAVVMYMSGQTQYPTALATVARPDGLELDSNFEAAIVDAGSGLPLNEWVCLEQHVRYGVDGRIELFVDGLQRYANIVDTSALGTLGRVWIGIDSASTSGSRQRVYVDDVVISTQQIGCVPRQ